jgi:hypothetical protein
LSLDGHADQLLTSKGAKSQRLKAGTLGTIRGNKRKWKAGNPISQKAGHPVVATA